MSLTQRMARRPAAAAGAALLTVGLGLLVACRTSEPSVVPAPEPSAVATVAPTLDVMASTELPVGVQVFEADLDTPALDHLRNAGVAWARTRALWKLIEPETSKPPRYDWSVTDRLIGETAAAGFRNVVVVYANPEWAAESECGPVQEGELGAYAAFWTALVERYDGDGESDAPGSPMVRYWQVSNEVDFDPTAVSEEHDYGGCFGDDPARYAEQLVVAYGAAKRASGDAQVGFGPVAYDRFSADSAPIGWTAAPGPFVYDFTQRALEYLYSAHAGEKGMPFFDFIAVHNYNDNADFWDSPPRHEMVAKLTRFRDEQLAVPGVYDLRDKPILVSETGLATSPSDEWTERSDELQAAYVAQTFVRARAAGAITAIWYTARDNIFGDCVPPHWDWLTFGLMRSSDYLTALEERCPIHPWAPDYPLASSADPRPAVAALATLTGELRGASFDGAVRPLVRRIEGATVGGDAIGADAAADAVEAYRFAWPDGRSLVVAWTTTGQRLGKRGVAPIRAEIEVDASLITPWMGSVVVTDDLGQDVFEFGRVGDERVEVALGQAPVYITAAPVHPTGPDSSRR